MDGLLTIGEFSDRCGLSPKMLRTYAAAGLLAPAAVDRVSGYRYYAPRQLQQARMIGRLRQAGMPVRDIASFLADPAIVRLDQWERDLDAEAAARRQALQEVRDWLRPTGSALPRSRSASGGPAVSASAVSASGPAGAVARPRGTRLARLTAESASAAGTARAVNQDAVLVGDELCVVADGMGERGALASVLAVEILQATFTDRTAAGLTAACSAANRAVWRRAEEETELTMATTVTAVAIVTSDDSAALAVISVGDSRAYLVRRGVARRVTEDHSLVAELVRAGQLTEAAARSHPQRFLLTRALGTQPTLAPGLAQLRAEPGDRLLLCTDGLFNQVSDPEIAAVLTAGTGPGEAAAELARLAGSRGETDDISVVVADVGSGPGPEPAS